MVQFKAMSGLGYKQEVYSWKTFQNFDSWAKERYEMIRNYKNDMNDKKLYEMISVV